MTESERSNEQSDMTPEEFADISVRALIALLGAAAAEEHVGIINELKASRDKKAVQNYLLGLTMSGEVNPTDFMKKVNELLESE